MKTRLVIFLFGALIALPSYAQDLRSIALKIIKNHPIEQSGSLHLTTVFQNKKTLQLQANIGEEGSHCYDFALWRSKDDPQKYLIALAYRILPGMRDGELLFFYHSPKSNTQKPINIPNHNWALTLIQPLLHTYNKTHTHLCSSHSVTQA